MRPCFVARAEMREGVKLYHPLQELSPSTENPSGRPHVLKVQPPAGSTASASKPLTGELGKQELFHTDAHGRV